jgi:hypothetical protein
MSILAQILPAAQSNFVGTPGNAPVIGGYPATGISFEDRSQIARRTLNYRF